MNFRTLTIAAALYFAIFLFAHRPSAPPAAAAFRSVHDLSTVVRRDLQTTTLVAPQGMTVDAITPDRFVVPLARIDVARKMQGSADYRVGFDDVADYEKQYGKIPAGAVVAVETRPGQSAQWDPKLIDFLRQGRHIYGVTLDAARDPQGAAAARADGLYLLSDLQSLGTVPPAGAILIVAPLKAEWASSAPARVYALVR